MIRLKLETISGTKYDDDVYEVELPTMAGQIGVLTGHMPLISVATHGVIKIRKTATEPDDMRDFFATNGGVIEMDHEAGTLTVLVDEADHADDISEDEAKKAYELAQKMKGEAKDQVSLEHAQSLMDRHAVRLQVAGLKRRHRNR
ncbi:MAG TPA: ATP synthase F1 subunit epsilon [Verrucomicrobiae bacterium]|nr:ATP synthase F1 subunit epsilon [Verrucomicrobiae bacterium]